MGFSTMAFTAKILSWRFSLLNIVGCLLKRRPTKGGLWAPQDPPVATLLGYTPFNKIDVSFLWVCPVIDHEFRHNNVKVAVDPRGDSQVDRGGNRVDNILSHKL